MAAHPVGIRAEEAGPEWANKLSPVDRADWQLIWTRHLNANLGTVGADERREAIRAFQKSAGRPQTGSLDATERALLASKASMQQTMTGFSVERDAGGWMEIGLPRSMLQEGVASEDGETRGTRWQTADRQLGVNTFFQSHTTLMAVDAKFCCLPGRKITYRGNAGGRLILEGTDAGEHRSFHIHARAVGDGIAGVLISFPSAQQKDLDHLVAAISSTMTPLSSAVAGSEWRDGTPVSTPSAASPLQVPVQKPIIPLQQGPTSYQVPIPNGH